MGEIYSTASCTTITFWRSLFTSSWIRGWFLGIANPEHPTCKGLSSNSSFVPWTIFSTSWSEMISFQKEICWDRHPPLKYLIHWYKYYLYGEMNSRNILTLDAHFFNICWWHVYVCVCVCVCARVCVCVCVYFLPSLRLLLTEQNNKCNARDQASDVWGNDSVLSTFVATS